MELKTQRLLLRPFRAGDHEAVHAFASDPEIVRWMDWGPNTPEETSIFLGLALLSETERPRRAYRFAVVRAADDALIGSAELHIESPENKRATMGYLIARPAQGHGYATEAGQALISLAFDELGLHRVTATCDPSNAGSAAVLRKIGMTQEGHLHDHFLIRGSWRDRLLFAVLNSQARVSQAR
ncbi:GNAT family protein [Winogradskya consettensis]|uniref:N-acetyltransferase n=1 Tax=Winogradskya consettensis TaxID=113560 RepID=A0A919S6U0_9ACTN|nr:GNAT family N-acetyltransferase [Actinoplanes consettensis]GIM66055.1 N-acetyltransferase [Actinoplanes consettensis]